MPELKGEARCSLPLLCERCGYDVDALPDDAHCPECGTPRVESLPERRTGTPWQREGGFRAFWRTLALVWMRPRGIWRKVSVGAEGRLRASMLATAALLYGVASAIVLEVSRSSTRGRAPLASEWLGWTITGLAFGLTIFFPLLVLLTWIESRGLRVIGRVHKFRITPEVASAVCAHAAAGWITGGVLAIIGSIAGQWLNAYASSHNVGVVRGFMMLSPGLLPLIAFAIGMLHFETLAYLGMRKMRYANG
ncbi:MAG: zinc ribbon domain-containing protein [Phycisphaerales bacterium]|jgi:hypothetical protein|nr:zinc ribbon domain-containing protein [Phycisphaerales bacterium]